MRRVIFAAVLVLVAGAAALRARPALLRPEPPSAVPASELRPPAPAAPDAAALPSAAAPDPLTLLRGNAATDRLLALEHRVRLYRKARALSTDEWIRLLNLIRVSAAEYWDAPPSAADAELAFVPGAFEELRAAARDLSRLAGEYYEAARTRNAAAVATYRPAFDEHWASFQSLVRQSLRR